MGMEKYRSAWGRGVALAVGYGLAYTALNRFSDTYWFLPAGLQLSALLLLPRRDWLAIILGEFAAVAYASLLCLEAFGWGWLVAHAIPPILLMAPVVAWALPGLPGPKRPLILHVGRLLLCIVALATLKACLTLGIFTLAHSPAGYQPPPLGVLWIQYFVRYYLGAALLVPLALMAHEITTESPSLPQLWRRISDSRFLLESIVLCTSMALLILLGRNVENLQLQQILHASLFVPIAWMTLRHGWRGTVIVGLVASGLVTMGTFVPFAKETTVETQAVIAVVTSMLLVLGARIAVAQQREKQQMNRHTLALAGWEDELKRTMSRYAYLPTLAQREVLRAEQRLRDCTTLLRLVQEEQQKATQLLLRRLRPALDAETLAAYADTCGHGQRQLHRLVDSLYPTELQRDAQGLERSLRRGPLPEALAEIGVHYRVEVRGSRHTMRRLSHGTKISLYRMACAAVAFLLTTDKREDCTRLELHVRCGETQGRSWLALRVIGRHQASDHVALAMKSHRTHALMGLAPIDTVFEDIASHAMLYGGSAKLHSAVDGTGQRIGVMLFDPESSLSPVPASIDALHR